MKLGIMVTGGMDSTALLYYAATRTPHTVYPITINYEHTAFDKQVEMLTWHINALEQYDVKPLHVIPIHFTEEQKHSNALFDPNYQCDEDKPLEEWDKIRYEKSLIEGRNAIMVLYAMGVCARNEIDELWTGYLYGKEEWEKRFSVKLLCGDNSPQFVDTMNVLSLMGFSRSVRLRAPFYELRLDKEEAYLLGKELGVNYDMTHTCYFPTPCHKCDNCLLRDGIVKKHGES